MNGETEEPVSAAPPVIDNGEEAGVGGGGEVSTSPAFQNLDELLRAGKLSATRAAQLKAKYTQLHEHVTRIRANETKLINDAKNYTQQLEKYATELEKADQFPENIHNEAGKLRQLILKYSNDLLETEDRVYQMNYKIENYNEEMKLLKREYERMPKEDEVRRQEKEITAACDEFRHEIDQRKMEIQNLSEDLKTRGGDNEEQVQSYEKLTAEVEELKAKLVKINSVPNEIGREGDRIRKQKIDLEEKLSNAQKEYEGLLTQLKNIEEERRDAEDDQRRLELDSEKQRAVVEDKEKEYNKIIKEQSYAKDREDILIADKATLDLNLHHLESEKKTNRELLARKSRDKDRLMRSYKKMEIQSKISQDNYAQLNEIAQKLKGDLTDNPRDMKQDKRLKEVRKEVDAARREVAQQDNLTAAEQLKLEQNMKEEEGLLYEQSDLRIEVVELSRLAAIKHDEREQKSRDLKKAEQRYLKSREELKMKELQIGDHGKKHKELHARLKEFAALYNVIKNERNKMVNLIQISTQKAAEMREKIKIMQNEIEILRTSVSMKEKQLQKQRLKHISSIVLRDSLRHEVSKQQQVLDHLREIRDQHKMDIANLNTMINQSEEQMVSLRKQFETAVQHRNDRGIQLIERNEEVCVFYEKINAQESLLRKGQVELQSREEDIRLMKTAQKEEQRQVNILRQKVPEKRATEQEVVTLQIQLAQCQERLMELEKTVENPQDDKRLRFLGGKDPSAVELKEKLEKLETRFCLTDERSMERDLILEQTARLLEREMSKQDNQKERTLNLSKEVNEMQARLKDMTRKLMAVVSELSMEQANSLKMQQEVKEKEAVLEQCYLHLERGEPPSEEIEREWLRMLEAEQRHQQDDSSRDDTQRFPLPGGITTTAEPRPNAYLPDEEIELPIPRPYGRHAPFKPQDMGSNMRHIRKPQPKPIEI